MRNSILLFTDCWLVFDSQGVKTKREIINSMAKNMLVEHPLCCYNNCKGRLPARFCALCTRALSRWNRFRPLSSSDRKFHIKTLDNSMPLNLCQHMAVMVKCPHTSGRIVYFIILLVYYVHCFEKVLY